MSSKKNEKKVYNQVTESYFDNETGQITSQSDIKMSYVESEPNFIKMYVDDILKLKNVPAASNEVLRVLLSQMKYGNIVVLIKPIKEIISDITGLKINTINKSVQNLCDAGILIRRNRGVYIVDPNLFAKGKWQDIKKLRLTIDYEKDGTKTINSDIAKQLKLNI
jgi:hypothetical protein